VACAFLVSLSGMLWTCANRKSSVYST
jgi:hypothetical protein